MSGEIGRARQTLEQSYAARLALAVGAATLGIAGASNAQTPSLEHHSPAHLEQIADLPGYPIGVSRQAKVDLKNASVVVQIDSTGFHNTLSPYNSCSGDVVEAHGQKFVSDAAHCEGKFTGYYGGNLDTNDFPSSKTGALNFAHVTSAYKAMIKDTNTYPGFNRTLSVATGIDVNTSGVDTALLKTKAVPNQAGVVSPGLSQHFAIPYMKSSRFEPGQAVAIYSSPVKNLSSFRTLTTKPVTETGRYIGMYTEKYADGRGQIRTVEDYVVVTDPKNESQDAGFPGASGSMFAGSETNKKRLNNRHARQGYIL